MECGDTFIFIFYKECFIAKWSFVRNRLTPGIPNLISSAAAAAHLNQVSNLLQIGLISVEPTNVRTNELYRRKDEIFPRQLAGGEEEEEDDPADINGRRVLSNYRCIAAVSRVLDGPVVSAHKGGAGLGRGSPVQCGRGLSSGDRKDDEVLRGA